MPAPRETFDGWSERDLLAMKRAIRHTEGQSARTVALAIVAVLCARQRMSAEGVASEIGMMMDMPEDEVRRRCGVVIGSLSERLRR